MTDPPERDGSAETAESVPSPDGTDGGPADAPRERSSRVQRQRKQVLLRLDPAMYEAITRWAADELRSTNAQIDYLLRKALSEARRLPRNARPHPRRGRPPREE
nr:hypothetical protein [Streptomyces bathyalis]